MKSPVSSEPVNRRDFIKIVTGFAASVMGAIIGLPAIGYLVGPALKKTNVDAWIPAGLLADYPIGSPKFFRFTRSKVKGWEKTVNSYGVFVVRKDENNIMAVSNVCTHLSCLVSWHADLQHYVSPCHDGHFDITGNVLSGPPPRPLDEFATKVEDGKLYIQFPSIKRS
jgi:menaquinol-cytochrome c reductase iron-sulfur subunit